MGGSLLEGGQGALATAGHTRIGLAVGVEQELCQVTQLHRLCHDAIGLVVGWCGGVVWCGVVCGVWLCGVWLCVVRQHETQVVTPRATTT